MLSFRVFVALHPRRYVSPPFIGRSLRTRPVPILSGRSRPCRDWLGVSPIPRRSSHPNHSLTGRSLRPGLDLSSNASLSTFNQRPRPCRDCLSVSSTPCRSYPTHSLIGRSLRPGPNVSIPRRSYPTHSLTGRSLQTGLSVSSHVFLQPSIEDPDPVGTVDCQPPLRRSPAFTPRCPLLP